jgi:tetratricopeptide (TPR) repeat protein
VKSVYQKLPKGAIVFILACALYVNTLGHEFVLDDAIVISENMHTQKGIVGWGGLLTKDTFHGFFKEEGKAALVVGGRYRPLSPMLFALIYQIVGNNTFIFHMVNILLYGLCCLLVFIFIRTFCQGLKLKEAELIAFMSALIFAAHPVHTEVVANIKGGDEIMSTIGAMICLTYLIKYQKSAEIKPLAIACVAFFLSLLAKENTVTLMAIAPLTLWMTAGKSRLSEIARPTFVLLSVFAGYFIIRGLVLGWSSMTNTPNELMNNPFLKYEGQAIVSFTWSEKLGTNFYTLLAYIRLLVFPKILIHDYYPRQIPIYKMTDILSIVSLFVHVGLGIWALVQLRKKNLIAYTILFYLFAMSITSNFVFPVGTNMSERFLFFPSVAFCLGVGYGIYHVIQKSKIIGWSCLAILVLLFSIRTITRNPAWHDNFTLFQTDVENAPNSAKLRNAAAGSLVTKFENLPEGPEKFRKMDKALEHINAAIQIHPNYKNAHLIKGNAHLYKKEYDQAIRTYEHALRLDPSYAEAKSNLAIALRSAGRHAGESEGNLDKSLEYLKRAYEMDPEDVETIRLLGVAYGMKGTHTKTVEFFSKLVTLRPQNADYWNMLGTAYHNTGQIAERDQALTKAKELDPDIFNK